MNNYEKFKVVRPIPPDYQKDTYGIPIIKKQDFSCDWNDIKYASLSNLKSTKERERTILSNFQYDSTLMRLWNNPENYISKFKEFYAILSPDFSVYTNMEHAQIIHNVFMNRWLGCFWQYLGVNIIPTISWGDNSTYDICFSGVEKESIVAISTVGISKNHKEFIEGFHELIKRINPTLIIVRGNYVKGMTGNLLFFSFEETFNINKAYEQLSFQDIPRTIYIGGDL